MSASEFDLLNVLADCVNTIIVLLYDEARGENEEQVKCNTQQQMLIMLAYNIVMVFGTAAAQR